MFHPRVSLTVRPRSAWKLFRLPFLSAGVLRRCQRNIIPLENRERERERVNKERQQQYAAVLCLPVPACLPACLPACWQLLHTGWLKWTTTIIIIGWRQAAATHASIASSTTPSIKVVIGIYIPTRMYPPTYVLHEGSNGSRKMRLYNDKNRNAKDIEAWMIESFGFGHIVSHSFCMSWSTFGSKADLIFVVFFQQPNPAYLVRIKFQNDLFRAHF